MLCHALKGSARGDGTFPMVDCVAAIETDPYNAGLITLLTHLIDEARDFFFNQTLGRLAVSIGVCKGHSNIFYVRIVNSTFCGAFARQLIWLAE